MSNAKWRKLFTILWELGGVELRWKFVRDERIFTAKSPPPHEALKATLGDALPSPYGAYSEIEWSRRLLRKPTTLRRLSRELASFP